MPSKTDTRINLNFWLSDLLSETSVVGSTIPGDAIHQFDLASDDPAKPYGMVTVTGAMNSGVTLGECLNQPVGSTVKLILEDPASGGASTWLSGGGLFWTTAQPTWVPGKGVFYWMLKMENRTIIGGEIEGGTTISTNSSSIYPLAVNGGGPEIIVGQTQAAETVYRRGFSGNFINGADVVTVGTPASGSFKDLIQTTGNVRNGTQRFALPYSHYEADKYAIAVFVGGDGVMKFNIGSLRRLSTIDYIFWADYTKA